MRRFVPMLAAALLLAGSALAGDVEARAPQAMASLPSPAEILDRYLETHKDRDMEEVLLRYSFRQTTVVEDLNDSGEVKERRQSLHEVFPVEGALFHRLVEKNGEPLTPKKIEEERERENRFRRKLAARRHRDKKKEDKDEHEVELSHELFDRYQWELPRIENVNGRPAYLLTFVPREGKLPVERRIDHALNKATGMIWVDVEETEVARIEVHLIDEVTFWGGLLGKISSFALRLDNHRTPSGDWVRCEEDL